MNPKLLILFVAGLAEPYFNCLLVRIGADNMADETDGLQSEDSFDLDKIINRNRDADRDSVDTLELLKGESVSFFFSRMC